MKKSNDFFPDILWGVKDLPVIPNFLITTGDVFFLSFFFFSHTQLLSSFWISHGSQVSSLLPPPSSCLHLSFFYRA